MSALREDVQAKRSATRHVFSKHIKWRIEQLHALDNFHGPIEVAKHWIAIALAITASILSWKYLWWPFAGIVCIVAVVQIGGRQRSLADVLHQAAHGSLAQSRFLNDFLGTFLSGYFVLQSLSGYRQSHVRNHHRFFGDKAHDPDYAHLVEAGICGKNRTRRNIEKHLTKIVSPTSLATYLRYLVAHRILPNSESRRERVLRIGFLLIGGFALILADLGAFFALFWIIPFLTTNVLIGSICELAEHYPMIDCEPERVDLLLTRNRHCEAMTCLVLGLTQAEGLHLVHHLFPRLPAWRVREAHLTLLSDRNYERVNCSIGLGWSRILDEVLSGRTTLTQNYQREHF